MAKFKPLRIRVGTKFQNRDEMGRGKPTGEVSRIRSVLISSKEWETYIEWVIDNDYDEPTHSTFGDFTKDFNAKDGFVVLPE